MKMKPFPTMEDSVHSFVLFFRKAVDLHRSGNDERSVRLACISWWVEWAQ